MEAFIFFIILFAIYMIIDDTVVLILLASFLVGVIMNLSAFITTTEGLNPLYYLILNIMLLAIMAKFYKIIQADRKAKKKARGEY